MKKVLIFSANPNKDSLGHSFATTYKQSAEEAGHEVKLTHIASLNFEYNLQPGAKLEEDLVDQQEYIIWADHIVICMPIWWYGPPANLKAFFDRAITPGFAYKYPHPWKPLRPFLPRRLLKGRSARIITTQDSFKPIAWVMGLPISWSMRIATLWYIGLWPARHTRFSRVRYASDAKRAGWTQKVAKLANKAR